MDKKSSKPKNHEKELKERLKEQELKNTIEQQRYKNRMQSLNHFFLIIVNIAKIIGFIVFVISLLAIVGFIIFYVILFINGENAIANNVLTALQVISGFVSLGVGIWALVLTLQSSKESKKAQKLLNIAVSQSYPNPVGFPDENDVDKSKL